ncbi:hypothetical protein IJJ27_00515 [bacterium]|nr:hypothetical protein [bacterium]
MNANDLDKTFINRMTTIAVLVVFGLVFWLIFENVLLPAKVATSDYAELIQTAVDPQLGEGAINKMRQGRVLSEAELSEFMVYKLDDSDESHNSDQFVVQIVEPQVPYDLGYIGAGNINSETDTATEMEVSE